MSQLEKNFNAFVNETGVALFNAGTEIGKLKEQSRKDGIQIRSLQNNYRDMLDKQDNYIDLREEIRILKQLEIRQKIGDYLTLHDQIKFNSSCKVFYKEIMNGMVAHCNEIYNYAHCVKKTHNNENTTTFRTNLR